MSLLKDKNVTVIGLGLMGGAFAYGFQKLSPKKLCAYDINKEVLESALQKKVIDFGVSDTEGLKKVLQETDLVMICLYPHLALDFINTYMADFKENAILTDITGVKQFLLDHLDPLRPDLDLILGHPMAGSEKEGFGHVDDAIFKNRNYILIPRPENRPENLAFIRELVTALGFDNIVETTAQAHDQKIAFTSQLCHVIASALVDSEEDLHITNFEGGSFSDLTRIAMINASMWTELFLTNKPALLSQLDKFDACLTAMREMIARDDEEGLITCLSRVRKKRILMEIDRLNKHNLK